jgi:hypothetical protein
MIQANKVLSRCVFMHIDRSRSHLLHFSGLFRSCNARSMRRLAHLSALPIHRTWRARRTSTFPRPRCCGTTRTRARFETLCLAVLLACLPGRVVSCRCFQRACDLPRAAGSFPARADPHVASLFALSYRAAQVRRADRLRGEYGHPGDYVRVFVDSRLQCRAVCFRCRLLPGFLIARSVRRLHLV